MRQSVTCDCNTNNDERQSKIVTLVEQSSMDDELGLLSRRGPRRTKHAGARFSRDVDKLRRWTGKCFLPYINP